MRIATETVWPAVVSAMGFEQDADLIAMHLAEFEIEAENVLQLLTVLRADARETDDSFVQDTAAELVVALEHLAHHLGELLLPLQTKLGVEP